MCVATLPCEMSSVFKVTIENKMSEVKHPTLSHKTLYKQTKLSKNSGQVPMSSVMTSQSTIKRINK